MGKVLVLFIIPLILYVSLLPVMPLMEPDEGRYSAISSSMNKSGDYVTPRLKEAVYLEKPPLAYWATALSFKIFGENDFSSRLFAGLCAWGCILLVYAMGTYFHDYNTGLYAAAVLTTSLFHFAIGRIQTLDMPVAFFLSLAIWFGYRYFSEPAKKWRLYLFFLSSALAFLTKGLIGIVFPAAIIIIWLISVKRWREIYKLISPLGTIIFLAVSLPWLILIQQAHSDFFRFFFIQEHFQRYTSKIHNHGEPLYFYIPLVIAGTLPWCAFLFKALKGKGIKWGGEGLFHKEETLFLLVWAGFIILFFSLSSSKLIPYITPVFLPLSVFAGRIFHLHDKQDGMPGDGVLSRYNLPVLLQSLLFILLLAAPLILGKRQIPFSLWWPWIIAPVILLSLLTALPEFVRKKTGSHWFITIYLLYALFLGTLLFPLSYYLTPYKSAYPLAQAIRKYLPAGQELYQFGTSLYGIDFYCKMRTPIVDDIGEAGYGSKFLPPAERSRYFLNSAAFFQLCQERQEVYCATKGQGKVTILRKEVPRLTVLWDNKYYYLLRLENSDRNK